MKRFECVVKRLIDVFLILAVVFWSGLVIQSCAKKVVKKEVPVVPVVKEITGKIDKLVDSGRYVDVTPPTKIEIKQPVVKKVAEKKPEYMKAKNWYYTWDGDDIARITYEYPDGTFKEVIPQKYKDKLRKEREKRQIKTQVIKSVAPVMKTKTFGIPWIMWVLIIIFFPVVAYLIYRGGKKRWRK